MNALEMLFSCFQDTIMLNFLDTCSVYPDAEFQRMIYWICY